MTDDEFNRIKEEEKDHLRQLRALKRAVHLLERQRSVTTALEEMTSRSKQVLEANERLIEEIALDTARNEARLDVAMEEMGPVHPDDLEGSAEARARAIVEDVRRQEAEVTPRKQDVPPRENAEEKAAPVKPDTLPEKTLGRMR